MSSLVLHVLTDHKRILKADKVQMAGLPMLYNVYGLLKVTIIPR